MPITLQTIEAAVYWPEKLFDSTVQTIAANSYAIQPIINLPVFDSANALLLATDLTTRQQQGLQVSVQADNVEEPMLITSLRPDGMPGYGSWPATSKLLIQLQNTTSAQILTQADVGLWVMPQTLALRYYFGTLSPSDEAQLRSMQNLKELVDDGLRPFTPEELIRREDMSWLRQEYTWANAVPALQRTQVLSRRVRSGRVLVLAGLSIDASQGGNLSLAAQQQANLQVHISREGRPDYLVFPAAGIAGGPSRVVKLWIPALNTLTVELTADVAYQTVPVLLLLYSLPLSTLNDIRWSLRTGARETPETAKLWTAVKAGLY